MACCVSVSTCFRGRRAFLGGVVVVVVAVVAAEIPPSFETGPLVTVGGDCRGMATEDAGVAVEG